MINYNKGFTLIELLCVIFLSSFIFMKNLSWVHHFVSDWKVTNVTKKLMSAISLSRNYAVDRGVNVTLCGLDDERICSFDGDWGSGWQIYLDDNRNGLIDDDEEVIHLFRVEDNVKVTWNNGGSVVFNSHGEVNVSGSFNLCLDGGEEQFGERLVINLSGRVRVEDIGSCTL